jgi:hypothetical protein
MDVRTVPVEVQQDGLLSISLDPELIRQMLEQAEEEGGEVTSADLGLTPEGNFTKACGPRSRRRATRL